MDRKVVFFSYSHDSDPHRARVLGLSERLRADGLDARLDQYEHGTPTIGWPRWMMDQLEAADFVLVVCTETYYRRFRGHEEPDKGKGADWEGAQITHAIYKARSATTKFVPVLFSGDDEKFIPDPLLGQTHYLLTSESIYEQLYDFLLEQAGVEPGEIGTPKTKPRPKGRPATFDSQADDEKPRIAVSRFTHVADRLFGREEELARLDAAWGHPKTNVVTLVAWGGVGKTSLVAKWAASLAERDYDGADYFDWSFYSQGTKEQGAASADQFVKTALEFFGDPDMAGSATSPWDKGARLAQLVAGRRALLVLDGLEPLQHPPGPMAGQLKDPAITALLKGLAQRNPGLCVVTTRERVADLAQYRDSTAPEWPLERLSTPAGVELLKTLGVHGAAAEIEKLVEDVRGHALTLDLLGRYLRDAHGGDVRKRDLVDFQEADAEVQGGHAFKTIAAYERWFAAEGEKGERLLAVLRLLGLFDRPADAGCLAALRNPPAIPDLTEPLIDLEDAAWNLALSRLRDAGLVTTDRTDGSLDAHPLVREYFARQLRDGTPEAWRAAHGRLFDHLQKATEHQPDTFEGLQPLYQAVAHGCQAGRHEEALYKVYIDRILRGMGNFYSTMKLGAIGADLGAVACFFERLWSRVSASVTEAGQAWLLNYAAFSLRALGRLTEALEPIRAALKMGIEQKDWKNAGIRAGNLGELELTLGELNGERSGAVHDAEQAVVFADRSGDAFLRMAMRTSLADALHQAGRHAEALAHFGEAEAMQAELQPDYSLLYSVQGFQYCDLLLADAERAAWRMVNRAGPAGGRPAGLGAHGADDDLRKAFREVENRGRKMIEWRVPSDSLLDIALDSLTLARVDLYRALLNPDLAGPGAEPQVTKPLHANGRPAAVTGSAASKPPALAAPRAEIEQAVDGLRRAGTTHHVPRGLLTRALLRSVYADAAGAQADLDLTWEIAERGPMPLFLADVHLHRARLFHAVTPYPWESPRADLAEARRLIEKHGYGRRVGELEDAEEAAEGW